MMHFTLVIPIRSRPEAQNYAVAPARGPGAPAEPADLDGLAGQVRASHEAWLSLYRDPDVWTDREKRRAMIRARLAYTDAFVAYEIARHPSRH